MKPVSIALRVLGIMKVTFWNHSLFLPNYKCYIKKNHISTYLKILNECTQYTFYAMLQIPLGGRGEVLWRT